MTELLRIGVIGDYHPEFHTHPPVAKALQHSAGKLGLQAEVEWVRTSTLEQAGSQARLERFDGLFAASGSPYLSFDVMLRGIEFARTRNWPFVVT